MTALILLSASLAVTAAIVPASAFTLRHSPVSSIVRNGAPQRFGVPRTPQGVFESAALSPSKPRKGSGRACEGKATALRMGYNLPPSGGGGRGPMADLKAILPGIVTIVGLALFFMSPLGGIFFAVTNTLLALAFITPVVAFVGFQLWQTFYTIAAPCPNCGFTVRTLKDDGGQPTLCINCGSLVRTNLAKDGVELCNDPSDTMFGNNSGFFGGSLEELFGVGGQGQQQVGESSTTSDAAKGKGESKADKARRERTVIDVDIESD